MIRAHEAFEEERKELRREVQRLGQALKAKVEQPLLDAVTRAMSSP